MLALAECSKVSQVPLELQQPPKLNKAQEMMIQRVIEKSKNSNKVKRVRFKSKAKADVKVQDLGLADNVTLGKSVLPLPQEVEPQSRGLSTEEIGRGLCWRGSQVHDVAGGAVGDPGRAVYLPPRQWR